MPLSPTITKTRSFITFGKPDIGFAEKDVVLDVLESGWLSTGEKVKEFEAEFSAKMGGIPCVAVSSCTSGLILSLMVLDIKPGDEVITSPLTFAATVNAILSVGAVPVFADVDKYGHLDIDSVTEKLNPKTKAVIPVHYTGSLCDMNALADLAHVYDLKLIEDAAHSFGVRFDNLLSDAACYSFYPNKNITCGEGGMVVAKSQELADKIRCLSMQGLSKNSHERYGAKYVSNYKVEMAGLKANLSDLHAAIGLVQIKRWDQMEIKRKVIWEMYEEAFGMKETPHSRHIYTLLAPNRDSLRFKLHEAGIGTGIHFNPLHLEPAYKFMGYQKDDFPQAEVIGDMTLSLPISSTMTADDANYVIEAVKREIR